MKYVLLGLVLVSMDASAGPLGAALGAVMTGLGGAGGLIAGALGGLAGGLLGKKPKMPQLEPPKVAPTPDDEGAQKARQVAMQRQYASRGRAGTILSENNTLG